MKPDWRAAARAGDAASLERLLTSGCDIDAKDKHGNTALMLAALYGHTAAARLLIQRGADLNHAAKFNLTALMLAVINRHVDIVRALADAGADLARRGSGAPGFHDRTALDLAVVREGNDDPGSLSTSIAGILRAALTKRGGA